MNSFSPTSLQNDRVVLEPLRLEHAPALESAAADGELWNLTVTSVPPPGHAREYVEKALQGQADGLMLPFAVREAGSGEIVGSTRYYEIDCDLPRLAIGYTWYAKRWQKGHLNTACKLLLLEHAFETLGCVAVAFHTDEQNEDSQRAIERLGAQREGVLRAHKRRVDGSLRTPCASASWRRNGHKWRTGWTCAWTASRPRRSSPPSRKHHAMQVLRFQNWIISGRSVPTAGG